MRSSHSIQSKDNQEPEGTDSLGRSKTALTLAANPRIKPAEFNGFVRTQQFLLTRGLDFDGALCKPLLRGKSQNRLRSAVVYSI
jgi:hypothetical protein